MPRDARRGGFPGEAPRARRWPAEALAVAGGWAAAAAARGPALLSAGPGGRGPAALALVAALLWWAAVVAVVRSDLRDFIIPDEASLAIAALGLAAAAGPPWIAGDAGAAAGAAAASLSVGAGAFAVFHLVGLAFRRFGRDALGFGDVKLAGASAIWLDPGDAALALEVAALGAIAALLLARREGPLREVAVPFGAFLAPSAWLVAVLAPPLRDALGLSW